MVILFNGNNEAYLKMIAGQAYLPDKWTTCPKDALDNSDKIARRYKSKMAVLVYTNGLDGRFRLMDTNIGCTSCEVNWYVMNRPLASRKERERLVKEYSEKDLAEFVKMYFNEEHLASLKAMKYWDLIFPGKSIDIGLGLRQEST